MSNLLQLVSKIIIITIISICIVNGGGLGVSPNKTELSVEVGKSNCVNYDLYQAKNEVLVKILWSPYLSPLGAEDYFIENNNIDMVYPPVSNSNQVTICFTSREIGEYHGLILFEEAGENIIIGSKIKIYSSKLDKDTRNILTGFSIINNDASRIIIIEIMFILIAILSILLAVRYRKIKESY